MTTSKSKKKRLGKGLDTLLGAVDLSLEEKAKAGEVPFIEVSLSQLRPGKYQPRKQMDEEALESLTESVRQSGVITPILIRKVGEQNGIDQYEIISGERRFRASQQAGKETIKAVIYEIDDQTAAQYALIENLQREDLNLIEEAEGIQRLIMEFNYTHEEVAKFLGQGSKGKDRSRSSITNLLRLLKLTTSVKEMLIAKNIEMGHARALLAIVDPATQVRLAQEVISKELNVRQTERLVSQTLAREPWTREKKEKTGDILQLERELSDSLATTVNIETTKKGKGRLVIEFANNQVLEGILSRLRN